MRLEPIDRNSFLAALGRVKGPQHAGYFAMYSSFCDGIVTDPLLMLLPIDDHMVHRGDGVFEAFKCVGGNLYNLEAHLARLARSAAAIELPLPFPLPEIRAAAIAVVRAGGRRDATVRVYVSRGPGSFGVNPYDCPRGGLYVVATDLKPAFMSLHPEGATARTSRIPAKPPLYAGIKNCNYLPNVLMKKEAADGGVDFVMALDAHGCLAEGPTENMGVVTRGRELLFPRLEGILRGTTMMRVAELARALVAGGELARVAFEDIPRGALGAAAELLVVGTTHDVVAVREYDGKPVGDGRPGPVYRALADLLARDLRENGDMLTPVFEGSWQVGGPGAPEACARSTNLPDGSASRNGISAIQP